MEKVSRVKKVQGSRVLLVPKLLLGNPVSRSSCFQSSPHYHAVKISIKPSRPE